MEVEDSLPFSQQPETCTYPEPIQSNPQYHTLFLLRTNVI